MAIYDEKRYDKYGNEDENGEYDYYGRYINEEDVRFVIRQDKIGKNHFDFYDKDPRDEDHESLHLALDENNENGYIVDKDGNRTDIKCFITTSCLRHFDNKFEDNCYELNVLRWIRDNIVTIDDKDYHYKLAPIIIECINSTNQQNEIYDNFYNNVIIPCIEYYEEKKYKEAYFLYKKSIAELQNQYAVPILRKKLVKTLKKENIKDIVVIEARVQKRYDKYQLIAKRVKILL